MNDTDTTAIFATLWKRWWLILAVGLLVGLSTYYYYKRQPTVLSSKTQVYLGAAAEEQGLFNNTVGKTNLDATELADQAALINSDVVAELVHQRLQKEHNLAAIRGKVKAKATAGSDFILITAEASTAKSSAHLANAYAQAYIDRHDAAYRREVRTAIANIKAQRRRIETNQLAASASKKKSAATGSLSNEAALQEASLSSKIDQFESDLSISGVQQVGPAKVNGAVLIAPLPKKNAIFGFMLGIVLAALAVYAASRVARRLHSLAEFEEIFHTQILTALPAVRTPVVQRDGQPAPANALLEPFRRLHSALQLEDKREEHGRPGSPRVILCISADGGDGKSTVIADLALVQRDAGERVAVVEADLRRPVQAELLGVSRPNGLADVLAGTLPVGHALQTVKSQGVQASARSDESAAGLATVVESHNTGSISVLLSGGAVDNPPALLADRTMTGLLRGLGEEFDHVLIDAPSPLEVSDVMPLLQLVDGIVLVARVAHTRETSARRLVQLLERTASAPVIGIVVNSVPPSDIERYGFHSAHGGRGWRHKLIGR
jgi:succinoglycan biosynthesis transport protein ExoP